MQLRETALRNFGCLAFPAGTEADQELALSDWPDEASIAAWNRRADHVVAQGLGRQRGSASYRVEVAEMRRRYSG